VESKLSPGMRVIILAVLAIAFGAGCSYIDFCTRTTPGVPGSALKFTQFHGYGRTAIAVLARAVQRVLVPKSSEYRVGGESC
jgi:hypothetical protein